MNRSQIKAIADSDLRAVTQIRHQLSSARMSRIAHAYHMAEQRAGELVAKLGQLDDEARQVRAACMRAVTANAGNIAPYKAILRALDMDMRRTHVRMDMQEAECRDLLHKLAAAKKRLGSLETRMDLYRKAEGQARVIREDAAEEALQD
jgi:hypothetical protein